MRLSRLGSAAVLVLIAGPVTAQQPYQHTRIADTSQTNFHFFDGQAAVNATGTVSFRVDYTTSGAGVYRGNGGTPTLIADNTLVGGSYTAFGSFGSPTINSAGAVAFMGQSGSNRSGIYVRGTASPYTPATPDDPHYNGGFSDGPQINNAGQVAFRANVGSSFGGGTGVFRYDNTQTTTEIARSGTNNFSTFLGDPSLNSSGTVLFKATLLSGGNGLFLGSGGAITTVTSTQLNPALQDIGGWSVLNDAGQVAYQSSLVGGGSAVYLYENGVTTTIAATGAVFSQVSNPALNGAGKVAFVGTLTAGGHGIYVGPDPITDKVIAVGDALSGSTVTGLAIGPRGFNDAGQLAFYATLADGREGVFLATPVPEPRYVLAAVMAVALALGKFRWGKPKEWGRFTACRS